ncbi:hypothetical protein XaplCFBP3122_08780 [Xanthomonas arboricola pv. populi]|uniref:YetF C-terminal domain-containing protein n=1 Tax=Xanthomonas arboricola pv. populi TaxID=487823 RepID=A0A2S6Z5P6_9XANT|nr:YetF domain-containing protein [Xanthomonas arboricola]PPT76765.1 hypothetical protein XaplCFBP3122_08780 [Xanthomonas arboricola pv. populi]
MLDVQTRVRFYEMMHLAMPWWEFVLRAVAVYTVVLLLTRMTGKRALGQSTPFDVLLIVLLGTAVQNSLIGKDVSLLGGMILAVTLLVLNWLVGMATARSRRIDTWVQGTPALLARGGEIYRKELVRHNVSYADFEVAKRKADCRDDADIDMAILETSGDISILKKRQS